MNLGNLFRLTPIYAERGGLPMLRSAMFNRLLACSLRIVITGLIALVAAVALVTGYSGFMYLVRIHVREAVWLLAVALVTGGVAALLASRRGDLADC